MKYKPILIGITIVIALFFSIYYIQDWASQIPGKHLDGQWQLEISERQGEFLHSCEKQIIQIPYHEFTNKSFFVRFTKTFDDTYKYLVLPFVSSSGYKVYLNDSLLAQVGDPENKTANVWNHVQVLTLDKKNLKQTDNQLTIEIYALYTYGIDKPPVLTDYPDTYVKVYIENLFRTYIPFISIGAAFLLGVILIVLGLSYKKTRKLFFYLGFCLFLSSIYIFEERYRITTGSLQTLLLMRKIASGSGFFAIWFFLAAMELYTTNKLKISRLLLIVTAFVVIFGFLQPDIYSFSNWVANSVFLNIITIFTAAILLALNSKGKEWLIAPIFFICLTFIHYLVTWYLLRCIGPNLSDIGLMVGCIGFGLILVVHFKELVRENLLMEKKTDELEFQKNEALKLAQIKSQIVAQTSHEIRNPLMGIMGMADALLAKELDEQTRTDVNNIRTCSLSLQEILNDLLDTAKIEAGKFVLHTSAFSLTELLDELDQNYSILAEQKGVSWEIKKEVNCPEYINTDRLRLSQILNNLLTNAIKFTDQGIVTLRVKTDSNKLVFHVIDTGVGIEESLQQQIFEPYSQLENSRLVIGTGLGLSIVKKLVTVFKGSLSLNSEKGKGSTFTLIIPYEKTHLKPDELETQTLQNRSVLIADDNKINVEVLTNYLSEMGISKISKAFDGLRAYEYIKENHYDLIIMDINMPGMNGTQVIEKFREDNIAKETIFVAITGMNSLENSQSLKNAGFNEVLSKPISRKQLNNSIKMLLSKKKRKEVSIIPKEIRQKLFKAEIDEETLKLIIHEFLKEVPPTMKKIHQGLLDRNCEQIHAGIHYLKSSLDYLGTQELLNIRRTIEEAARQKNIMKIKIDIEPFEKEIMRLIAIYRSYLDSTAKRS